jgi:hypothetical protein
MGARAFEVAADRGRQSVRTLGQLRRRRVDHRVDRHLVVRPGRVQAQRRLERGDLELVHPDGASDRMGAELRDQVRARPTTSTCGPPSSFVAAARRQIGAVEQGAAQARLVGGGPRSWSSRPDPTS